MPYTQKNVVPLVSLFTFMPVKEEMKSSFTLQKNLSLKLAHCHLQNASALFIDLEKVVLHISLL